MLKWAAYVQRFGHSNIFSLLKLVNYINTPHTQLINALI